MIERKICTDFSIFIDEPYVFKVTTNSHVFHIEISKKIVYKDKVDYINIKDLYTFNGGDLNKILQKLKEKLRQ